MNAAVGMEIPTPTRHTSKLRKVMDVWCSTPEKSSNELDRSMFPTLYRTVWVEIFLKCNTAIPSSVAVELVFSQGSDIIRPKKSSLTSDNFEWFVFLKGNRDLLRMEEEEES